MYKYTPLFLLVFLAGSFTTIIWQSAIEAEDVRSAAKIAGLEMTAAEIDSLLPNLKSYREDYLALREKSIDNSVAPSLVFDPIPLRGLPDVKEKVLLYAEDELLPQVQLPANRDKLAFYSVRQLGQLIKTKKISSVALTQFFLQRLKAYDPKLHCVITLTEERAMQAAQRADREIAAGKYRGPLHGIPYGAKDLLAVDGYLTTWGAQPYREQKLNYDATVINKLDSAGAVLIAKLTLGALAWGDVWFGDTTRNPWDVTRGSSGSSAGSASATAAGLVPFALGTETLGSIVSPSTVCGATGLRPTFGRVSRHGAMALSWSMDKIGPICRSADDCALVLDAIRGFDPHDAATRDYPFNYDYSNFRLKRKRIGYVANDFAKNYAFKSQDSISLYHLEKLGYEMVPIELPDYPAIGFILQAEAAAAFDELTRSNRDDELTRQVRNAWPNEFRAARFIPAVEYIQATRARRQLIEEMADLMATIDLYVHPSWASQSLRITNMTGHPCITVPNGFQDGRPTSITFTGQLYQEAAIINVAQAFQLATDFDDKHPPGF